MDSPHPLFLNDFPYPVAYPYALIFAAEEKLSERLWALCFTQYQLVRLVDLTLVCQYLREEKVAEDKPDVLRALNKAVAGLRAPLFSDWLSLLYNFASNFPRLGLSPALIQFGQALDRLARPLPHDLWARVLATRPGQALERLPAPPRPLEAIIELRNSIAHGGLPGGSADRSDEQLAAYVPILHEVLGAFDFLAACRLLVWCDEDWALRVGRGRVRTLRGQRPPEPSEEDLSLELKDAFEESRAALVTGEGKVVPLLPFFNPLQETEPLYLYDGHFGLKMHARQGKEERAYIYYMGTSHRLADATACDLLRERLERRQVSFFLEKAQTAPWTIADSALDYSRQTLGELIVSKKYLPACYEPLPELETSFDTFLQVPPKGSWKKDTATPHCVNGLLLAGFAGVGKTAFLARQVERLLPADTRTSGPEHPNVVLFLRGDGITGDRPGGVNLFRDVAERLGVAVGGTTVGKRKDSGFSQFPELFDALHARWLEDRVEGRRFVLIVDAVNEAENPGSVINQAMDLIACAARYPWCKVVLSTRQEWLTIWTSRMQPTQASRLDTVRPFLFVTEASRGVGPLDLPTVSLPAFTLDLAGRVYDRYQQTADACRTRWGDLSPTTRNVLTNPLHLHLFMEAFAGRPAATVESVPGLFGLYVETALSRRPGLWQCVEQVVTYLLADSERQGANLDDDDFNQIRQAWAEGLAEDERRVELNPVEALCSEGFMSKRVREEGGGYRFVFQKVAEYLIYRNLARQRPSNEDEYRYWLRQGQREPAFFEYAAAFAFLFRQWARDGNLARIGPLVENGAPWLTRVLFEFLWEQALSAAVSGQVSEAALELAAALEKQGGRQCGFALQSAADQLAPTQYLHAALVYYPSAIALLRQVPPLDALKSASDHNLAWVSLKYGMILGDFWRWEEAEAHLERSVMVAQRLWEQDPFNHSVGAVLALAWRGRGQVWAARGLHTEAADAYRRSVEAAEQVHEANPDQEGLSHTLGLALLSLAGVQSQANELEQAEETVLRALHLGESMVEANASSTGAADMTGTAWQTLARLKSARGDAVGAEKACRRAHQCFYERWLTQQGNLDLGFSVIDCLQNLGDIVAQQGRLEEGQQNLRNALLFLEDWHTRKPESLRISMGLIGTHRALAALLAGAGKLDEARVHYQKALAVAEPLWTGHPDNLGVGETLIDTMVLYGYLLRGQGDFTEAEKVLRRAVEVGDTVAGPDASHLAGVGGLSSALQGLGSLYQATNRFETAEPPLRRAVALAHKVWQAHSGSLAAGRLRGVALENLAGFLWVAGRSDEAKEVYENLLEFYETLHDQAPQVLEVALGLARVLDQLGFWYKGRGRIQEAESFFQKETALLEPLQRAAPTQLNVVELLATALLNLGDLQSSSGRSGKAGETFVKAIDLAAPLWEANHRLLNLGAKLAGSLSGAAHVLKDAGNLSQAEDCFRQALDIRKELAAAAPDDAESVMAPVWGAISLAVLLNESCRSADAEKVYREHLPLLERLIQDNPRQVNARYLLGIYQLNLGWLLVELGRSDEALTLLEESRQHLTTLHEAEPRVVGYATTLAKILNNLSIVQTDRGQIALAEQTFLQARELCARVREVNPNDQEYCDALGWTLNEGGRLSWGQGQMARARACWDEARVLLEKSASAPYLRRLLGRTLSHLAEAAEQFSSADAVRPLLDRGEALYSALAQIHAGDVATRRGRGVWLTRAARLWLRLGQPARGAALAREALDLLEPLARADPAHAGYRVALAEAQLAHGDSLGGSDPEAVAAWTAARQIFDDLNHLDARHLGWKLGLARCRTCLGQKEQARALLDDVLRWFPGNREALRLTHAQEEAPADETPAMPNLGAEEMARRVLTACEKEWGPEHLDVAQALSNLARLYRDQGKLADATPLLERVLAIRVKHLGEDHADVESLLDELGQLSFDAHRYAEAESHCRRLLGLREQRLGPEHVDVITVVRRLALAHEEQGQFAEAEPLHRRVLVVCEKILGPESPVIAKGLSDLAAFYGRLGRHADAVPLYERSLAIREKALGPEHAEVADTLSALGDVHRALGQPDQAEPLYRRALAIYEAVLGPGHASVAGALNRLGVVCYAAGRPLEAEPLYRRAIAVWEQPPGVHDLNLATCLRNLSLIHEERGDVAAAAPLVQRALALRESALGPDHPDVVFVRAAYDALHHALTTDREEEIEPKRRWWRWFRGNGD